MAVPCGVGDTRFAFRPVLMAGRNKEPKVTLTCDFYRVKVEGGALCTPKSKIFMLVESGYAG